MVSHPVHNYFKPQFMRLLNQVAEIGKRAEFRVGSRIIGTGVVAAESTKPPLEADWSYGHEPENLHSHRPQTGKMTGKGLEGSGRSILPKIYFVNIAVEAPGQG